MNNQNVAAFIEFIVPLFSNCIKWTYFNTVLLSVNHLIRANANNMLKKTNFKGLDKIIVENIIFKTSLHSCQWYFSTYIIVQLLVVLQFEWSIIQHIVTWLWASVRLVTCPHEMSQDHRMTFVNPFQIINCYWVIQK